MCEFLIDNWKWARLFGAILADWSGYFVYKEHYYYSACSEYYLSMWGILADGLTSPWNIQIPVLAQVDIGSNAKIHETSSSHSNIYYRD